MTKKKFSSLVALATLQVLCSHKSLWLHVRWYRAKHYEYGAVETRFCYIPLKTVDASAPAGINLQTLLHLR